MSSPLDLLQSLGVRGRQGVASPAPAQTRTIDGMNFAALLEKASAGEISSGLEVTISDNAGVNLSGEQLQRLAKVADQAEAQGATRVLVLMDGKALTLDVGVRQVTGTADTNNIVTGIDAVVMAPATTNPTASIPSTPPSAVKNTSLLNALAAAQRL